MTNPCVNPMDSYDFHLLLADFLAAEDSYLACFDDPLLPPLPSVDERRQRASDLADSVRAAAKMLGGRYPQLAEHHLGKNFGVKRS